MGEAQKSRGGCAGKATDCDEQRGAVPSGGRSVRPQDGGQALRQVRCTVDNHTG